MPFAFSRLSSFGNSVTSTQDPFADQQPTKQDPFADQPPTEQDPFADQPPTEQDPFADQPPTGQDPFADEANSQQVPKLQPREIPAEPEEIVDKPEQAAVTGSSDTAANTEQNSETGVPVVQTQPKLPPTSSFIPEFDPLYLLPAVVPVLLVWLWLRGRKNRANKLQAYRQWQSPDSLPTGPNSQPQPVWRPVQREPSPRQPVSDKPARFRTGTPSPEEIELSLDESGEELHIGELSAIDELDSEEFDFSAESDLELDTETTHQAAHTGSDPGEGTPDRTTTARSDATVPAENPRFATTKKDRFKRSGASVASQAGKNTVDSEGKSEAAPVVAATAERPQLAEPDLDETFAEDKEATIARELDAELENVELDDSRVQVTDFQQQIRSTNETWTKRLDEQKRLQHDLENRAAKAKAQLAETIDKSVVVELQNKLKTLQADFEVAHKQKESLAAKLSDMEAFAKRAETDAAARYETAQHELEQAQEQAASNLAEVEEKPSAQLGALKSEYEAKLADVQSQAAETITKADQKAAAKLAEAQTEAAKKLAEVEAQAIVKITETEKKLVDQLAEAQAKAAKQLAEVKSQAAVNVSEAETKFADQLANTQREAAKKLVEVESLAAEKVAEAERNAATQFAEQEANAAAKLSEVESQVASKLAEAESKVADELALSPTNTEFAKVKAETAAKIAEVKEKAAEKLAEVTAEADARIADAEAQVAAKLLKAEEQAAADLAEAQTKADARIAEIESQAAAKLANAEEQAAANLAEVTAEADARIADAEAQVAAKLLKAEKQAAANLAQAESKADARIAEIESQAAANVAKAEETAATKIADSLENAEARIADVKAQAEEKIAAADEAARQSEATAKTSSSSTGTGAASPGKVKSETVARIVHKYKKERARRIEIQEMLDEAEVHRSVLSKQIKDLQKQISSEKGDSD